MDDGLVSGSSVAGAGVDTDTFVASNTRLINVRRYAGDVSVSSLSSPSEDADPLAEIDAMPFSNSHFLRGERVWTGLEER